MVMNGGGGDKVETMSVDAQTMPPRPRPSTITAHDYNHCTNRCVYNYVNFGLRQNIGFGLTE